MYGFQQQQQWKNPHFFPPDIHIISNFTVCADCSCDFVHSGQPSCRSSLALLTASVIFAVIYISRTMTDHFFRLWRYQLWIFGSYRCLLLPRRRFLPTVVFHSAHFGSIDSGRTAGVCVCVWHTRFFLVPHFNFVQIIIQNAHRTHAHMSQYFTGLRNDRKLQTRMRANDEGGSDISLLFGQQKKMR